VLDVSEFDLGCGVTTACGCVNEARADDFKLVSFA
jgi:hypothetical protein